MSGIRHRDAGREVDVAIAFDVPYLGTAGFVGEHRVCVPSPRGLRLRVSSSSSLLVVTACLPGPLPGPERIVASPLPVRSI